MSTSEYALRPVPQVLAHEVVAPRRTKRWIDWILTTDHKRIGILYLVTTFVFFMLGGVEALLMRSQLASRTTAWSPPSTTTSCSPCTGRRWSSCSWCR